MQKNGNLTNYRIHGYTYARKKILAPLVLQPAPSLVRTSLHHCRRVRTMPTHGYSYETTAAWGAELQSGTLFNQCVGAHVALSHAQPIKAKYLNIVAIN